MRSWTWNYLSTFCAASRSCRRRYTNFTKIYRLFCLYEAEITGKLHWYNFNVWKCFILLKHVIILKYVRFKENYFVMNADVLTRTLSSSEIEGWSYSSQLLRQRQKTDIGNDLESCLRTIDAETISEHILNRETETMSSSLHHGKISYRLK